MVQGHFEGHCDRTVLESRPCGNEKQMAQNVQAAQMKSDTSQQVTDHSIEAYLSRLRSEVQFHKSMNARIVEEAREHLLDVIDASVQRGLSIEMATREAFARFGDPDEIGGEFRRLYRRDNWFCRLVRVVLSVVVSFAAALVVQLFINLRFSQSDVLRLAPEFSQAVVSVTIVVRLATAWEISRKPFEVWRAGVGTLALVLIWVFAHGLFTP
jgi:hypothetical protein